MVFSFCFPYLPSHQRWKNLKQNKRKNTWNFSPSLTWPSSPTRSLKQNKKKNTWKFSPLTWSSSPTRSFSQWTACWRAVATDGGLIENYQLFIVERLIMMGAKTFKEDETELSFTDDPKKNTKSWQISVYTLDEEGRWWGFHREFFFAFFFFLAY